MSLNVGDISIYLMILNVGIAIVLFIYAYYLFRLERKIRATDRNFDEQAESIITEANKKALQIITKSEYVSSSLKKEVDENFDSLLESLQKESMEFYQSLKQEYEESSHEMIEKFEKEGEEELDQFAKQITQDAVQTRDKFEKAVEDDYVKSHEELEQYKAQKEQELEAFKVEKQTEFEAKLKARVAQIVMELMPGYISKENQERLVKDAIQKAYKEISLTS